MLTPEETKRLQFLEQKYSDVVTPSEATQAPVSDVTEPSTNALTPEEQSRLAELEAKYGDVQQGTPADISTPEITEETLPPETDQSVVQPDPEGLAGLEQAIAQEEAYLAKSKNSPELEDLMKKVRDMLPKESVLSEAINRVVNTDKTSSNLFTAVAVAETGGESDPYLRTRFRPEGGSTAYGPVQITGTLAKDFYNNRRDLFSKEEKDYLKRFLDQAKLFNKYGAEPDKEGYDPRYDYGGQGDLTSPEDRELYEKVAKKMLSYIFKKNKGDIDKTLKEWRFGASSKSTMKDDPKYFKKIKAALNMRG